LVTDVFGCIDVLISF